MAAGISIISHPYVSIHMLLQDEDVTMPGGDHSGGWGGTGETQPVGCKIQFWNDPAKQFERCPASTEVPRTASRSMTYDLPVTCGHTGIRHRCASSLKRLQSSCVVDLMRLRKGEVTRHGDVAFAHLMSSRQTAGFRDGGPEHYQDKRNEYSTQHMQDS